MEFDLQSILNLFLFAGVVQGIIVAVLLTTRRSSGITERLLASWILLLTLSNVHILFSTWNLYLWLGQWYTLLAPLSLNLLFGPIIWLFCGKATDPEFKIKGSVLFHLMPGLLEFLYYLIAYLQPLAVKQDFYGRFHWPYIEPSLEVLATVSFAYYLWKSIRRIDQYAIQLKINYSNPDLNTYDWLRKLLNLLMIFALLWLLLTLIDVFIMGYELGYIYFYPYYLMIAFVSYFIGFSGYFRRDFQPEELPILDPNSTHRTSIDQEQLHRNSRALETLMTSDKLFLQPDLRAKDVAKALGITVQTLSYTLNQGMSISFHDYINQLRVNQVKIRLEAGDLEHMNLKGIARESGFHAESSFYRIFKQHTGQTPKAYLSSL